MNVIKLIFKTFFLNLCIIANIHFAYAQSSGGIIPNGLNVFLDNNGKPLSSGKVYFYTGNVGSTTPKTTYSDVNLTTPNANPVILDAAGRPNGSKGLWGTGNYRQVVQDKNSNVIWDVITSAAGSSSGGSAATGDGDLVGTIKPWAGMTAPNQYMFTYGQEISRTTYSTLFTAITSNQPAFCTSGSAVLTGLSDTSNFWIGMSVEVSCVTGGASTVSSKTSNTVTLAATANLTTNTNATFFPWGRGNGTTTFNLPDFRGLIPTGNNIMGGVASTNISNAYFGNKLAESSGAQGGNATSGGTTLIANNIPSLTSTNASQSISVSTTGTNIGQSTSTSSMSDFTPTGTGARAFTGATAFAAGITASGNNSISATYTNASPAAFSILPPSKTVNFIIKVTPDTNSSTASGVTSLGGMTGDIACGTGILCTGNIISVSTSTDATNVTYTAPGTGAVRTTQQLFNQRVLWASDFGAICDGVTDDTAKFQNLINEAISIGAFARYIGTCKINSQLTVNGLIDFGGAGRGISVLTFAAGITGILLNSDLPANIHDQSINFASSNALNIGIKISGPTSNSGSRFDNLFIGSAANGIEFDKADSFVVSRVIVSSFSNAGIAVQNQTNADSGDSTIYGSQLIGASNAVTCVYYQSSGGLRYENNKCNGINIGSGLNLSLISGGVTGVLQIVGNSFEGLSTTGYGIALSRQGTIGTFQKVVIDGNEFAVGPLKCVYVPTDTTGSWLTELVITSNTCSLTNSVSAIAFDIDSVNGFIINNNAVVSSNSSTKMLNIGSSVTACTLNLNNPRGTFAADTGTTNCSLNLAGLRSGTSGGIPYYSATGQLAFSATLAANALVIGGGTGVTPSTITTGTSVITALGNSANSNGGFVTSPVANANLANSSTTVNSQTCTLGLTCTVTAVPSGSAGGDLTGIYPNPTLAGVITAGGPTGSATVTPIITYDAKGRLTAVSSATITPAVGSITGLGTGVATALGVNIGTAGSFIVNGGALGSPSSAGTLPAFTLGGTVSGGGNQINNVIIGASTPLAGTFATITGTSITDASSPTVGAQVLAGGLAIAKKVWSGSNGVFAATSANINDSGFTGIISGNGGAKASGTTGGFVIVSDDALNPMQATYQLANNATAGNRRLIIQAIESGVAFRNISLAENGGTVTISSTNGQAITAGDVLAINGQMTANNIVYLTGLATDAATTDRTVCQITASGKLAFGSGTLGVCLGTSSARYKKDIAPMTATLNQLSELQPSSFFYKNGHGDNGARRQFGFMAEDLDKTLPALVHYDLNNKPNSVDLVGMIPFIVQWLQELKTSTDNLEKKVNSIK